MIKIYFSICFSILLIRVHAQQVVKQNVQLKNNLSGTSALFKTNIPNSVNALTCDTLTTITRKDTLTLYSVTSSSAALNGGYVTGNNHYGDSAIATFIPVDTSLMPSGTQISGVKAVFYNYGGMGTKGSQTITLNIFTGDTLHGPTTTTTSITTGTVVTTTTVIAAPIGTATASLAAISSITRVSNAVDSAVIPVLPSNYQIPYVFSFASPITIPDTGFFISLTLPTTAGDTVVLLCTRNDSSKTNYAWDYGIHGWRAYSNSNDWRLYTSLTLFPIVCSQPAGINQATSISNQVTIYPNPANKTLNVQCSMFNGATEVEITDVLGNTIIQHSTLNTQHFTLDVSGLLPGVYFIGISSQNNKATQKLIIR